MLESSAMTRKAEETRRAAGKQRQKRKAKILAVVGFTVLVLTYVAQTVVKEYVKDVAATVGAGEALYRTEGGQSTISIQIFQTQQQIQAMRLEISEPEDKRTKDYTAAIADDLRSMQSLRAQVETIFDSTSRFIEKLPINGNLKQQLDQCRPGINQAEKFADEAAKPTPKNDWVRLVGVKIGMVGLLIQAIPVLVVGDHALTAAKATEDLADKINRLARWAAFFLYVVGAALTAFFGIEAVSGG